jgi:hypothetical protein
VSGWGERIRERMSNVANAVERRNDSAVIVVALLIMKVAKTKHMIQ